jgi:NitT/TauT family transport system permease protein
MAAEKYQFGLQDSLTRSLSLFTSKKWWLRGLSVAVFLAVWEWYGRQIFLIAPPSEVAFTLYEQLLVERTLAWALADAARQAVLGYLIAVVVGVPFGFLLGFSEFAGNVFDPIIDALYVTPIVALVPLIIVWFGIGLAPKVFLVAIFAVFAIIINTEAGITETPEGMVQAAKVFGASDRQVYTQVHLRHSLPYVLTGLRMGSGRAVRGMVVAELFISADKLGSYLVNAGSQFNIDQLFAGIALLSITGYVVVQSFEGLESYLLQYRETGE